jgi:hypothetical protein
VTSPSASPDPAPAPDPIAPIQVDLARVVVVGTVAWGVAFVVCLLLAAFSVISWMPVAVCAVGALLGIPALWWAHGHDRMGRRL